MKGDSGGPVFDKKGKVVGMCLGGSTGRPKKLIGHESLGELYVSYITPMELLLKRIHDILGRDTSIVVPRLDELSEITME